MQDSEPRRILEARSVQDLREVCRGRVTYVGLLYKHELVNAILSSPHESWRNAVLEWAFRRDIERVQGARGKRPLVQPTGGESGFAVQTINTAKRAALDTAYLHEEEYCADMSEFMTLPTPEEYDDCIRGYIRRTSNEALRSVVCAVCAREVFAKGATKMLVSDIPHAELLRPDTPIHHWELSGDGLGLHRSALESNPLGEESGSVCAECLGSLKKNTLPLYALANNLWIGEVPFALAVLTRPEQLLVSLYFPTAFVYKLHPKSARCDPDALQTGYRGNVSTYRMDTKEVAAFICPRSLPHPPRLLASTIAVTFVGPRKRPEACMRGLFRVRRSRVRDALRWLKEHNPLYGDIEINEVALEALPLDDIPDAVAVNARWDAQQAAGDEVPSYVPDVGADSDDEEEVPTSDNKDRLEPSTIPLQEMGVVDVEHTDISSTTLLRSAIANLSEEDREEGLAIQRGGEPVNEWGRRDTVTGDLTDGGTENPNHLLGAFPCLFPYGKGGFETKRPRKVSYGRHCAWALDYGDRRFRLEHAFIATVFGVLHKRQVCASASLQVKRSTYERCSGAIASLQLEDFQQACREEEAHLRYSNPAMALLHRELHATSSRVMGSDASRKSIRRRIWGFTSMGGPPTVWATINLCDVDDPIAQVFAGEEVDMDNFLRDVGPDAKTRRCNIARDPYAAAKFFHFVVEVLLEELFGVTKGSNGSIGRKRGVLGKVRGYIGVVESQARGTLHLHILFWLVGAPTGQQMKDLLKSDEFQERIKRFIDQNVRAHLDGIDEHLYSRQDSLQSHVAWSRPVDPDSRTYLADRKRREFEVAAVSQRHNCGPGCQKTFNGKTICKRRAPFPLAKETYVLENGEWGPKRTFPWLNGWSPAITETVGANNDSKIVTSGGATQALAFYTSEYMTKKQVKSTNSGALISRRATYHFAEVGSEYLDDRETGRRLLYKCLNTLARQHELSAPELVSYLKGWGDRYYSHTFVSIHWGHMMYELKREFPELREAGKNSSSARSRNGPDHDDDEQHDVLLTGSNNRLAVRSQLADYRARGDGLRNMGVLRFLLRTYEAQRRPDVDETQSAAKRSERHPYLTSHPRYESHERVVRRPNHETLPEFIGPWFSRRDDSKHQGLYQASMLLLFKPWSTLADLQSAGSFQQTFEEFLGECSQHDRNVMDNIQYYYDTVDKAEEDRQKDPVDSAGVEFDDEPDAEEDLDLDEDVVAMSHGDYETGDTDADALMPDRMGCSEAEWLHGTRAVQIASDSGVFSHDANGGWQSQPVRGRTSATDTQLTSWVAAIDQLTEADLESNDDHAQPRDVWIPVPSPPDIQLVSASQPLSGPVIDELRPEQRRAFEIVDDHLTDHMMKKQPPQLRMFIIGEAGTGKSRVIDAISWAFEQRGMSHLLAKVGSTGVAGNLVGGTTLHYFAVLGPTQPSSLKVRAPSDTTKKKREQRIRHIRYLLVDEFSMLTQEIIAALSDVAGTAHAEIDGSSPFEPFGGILNVILVGDSHQFPPVQHASTALYKRDLPNAYSAVGRGIVEQFDTVVLLKEQMRVVDVDWAGLLSRARYGDCNEADISRLNGLVLSNPLCDLPDFSSSAWQNAVLVTPRNATRIQWNSIASRKWCRTHSTPLFVIKATDVIGRGRRSPTIKEKRLILERKEDQTAGLASVLEVAVGMPVFVTLRHRREKSLTKGAKAIVKEIMLDEREADIDQTSGIVHLRYAPRVIVIHLEHPPAQVVPGFQAGEMPLQPSAATFSINPDDDKKRTLNVSRQQYALTPGFAFTDYKAQGQTVGNVIVDIGKPARGPGLSQFNVYVAMTRARKQEAVRLLRPFDQTLFTRGIDEDLRAEDDRLQILDSQTKSRHEKRKRVEGISEGR